MRNKGNKYQQLLTREPMIMLSTYGLHGNNNKKKITKNLYHVHSLVMLLENQFRQI